MSIRVRPGIHARLLDVSAAGAQIETGHRLLPGRVIHVQLACPSCTTTVRARVTRSDVGRVTAEQVAYRCGLHFDRRLHWAVEHNGVRYVVLE